MEPLAAPSPIRRKLAFAILAIGAAVIGTQLAGAAPRDVQMRLDLGPSSASITSVEAQVSNAEGVFGGFELRFADGAPPLVDHTMSLPPGSYRVRFTLRGPLGQRFVERRLDVPTEGIARFTLFEAAFARATSHARIAGGAPSR